MKPHVAEPVAVDVGISESPVELNPDVVVLEGGLAGGGAGDGGAIGPLGQEGDVMVGMARLGQNEGDDDEEGGE